MKKKQSNIARGAYTVTKCEEKMNGSYKLCPMVLIIMYIFIFYFSEFSAGGPSDLHSLLTGAISTDARTEDSKVIHSYMFYYSNHKKGTSANDIVSQTVYRAAALDIASHTFTLQRSPLNLITDKVIILLI